MANSSWRGLEVWERVKWARARKFGSAAAAAASLDMQDGTYRCYERGPDAAKNINLDYKHARVFARAFNVRWQWMLDGEGEPWLTDEDREGAGDGDEDQSEPPNQLRRWREYRNLSVAELSKKSGLSAQTITSLEAGEMDTSTKLLEPLARVLSTNSGFLIGVDPFETDPDFFEAVNAIPKERRSQALAILKTFRAPRQR